MRVGEGDQRHAGGVRGTHSVGRVLDCRTPGRDCAEPPRGLEVNIGRGLAPRHLLRGDGRREAIGNAGCVEDGIDQRTIRRRGNREREGACKSADCFDRAGNERQCRSVAVEHAAHDFVVDLLRRLGQTELLVHVPRPFTRAHAHHRPLCLGRVAPAPVGDEPLAHLVPHLFGVDDHAVHVEYDRLDHSADPTGRVVTPACRGCPRDTARAAPRRASSRAPCRRGRATSPATSRRE